MIDTIKFLIPFEDIMIIERLKHNLTRFRKEDLRTKEVKFEFYNSNPEFGSHHRAIAIKTTNDPSGFFVEFSVPKYERGNNVEMIYSNSLISIMDKFYPEICEYMNYQLPPYQEWPIYRLDLCYNWILGSEEEANQAMSFIQRIDYPRKQKYIYDTSVMYKGSAYTIKFYLKGPEFRKNDFKKIDINKAYNLQVWADKIVRFEVNLKRLQLTQVFELKKIYIKDIFDDSVIQNVLNTYLQKVFFYINAKTTSDAEIESILFNNFSIIFNSYRFSKIQIIINLIPIITR